MKESTKNNTLFVASIEKGMAILQAFNKGDQYLGLLELTSITGMNKSAVQRFTYTLESLGYLTKNPKTRQYRLTAKAMDIAYSYLRSSPLIEIATPKLIDFKNRTKLTINLSVLDSTDIVYVLRTPSLKQSINATLTGRRVPAFCTAGGRAILASLPNEQAEKIIAQSNLQPHTPYTQTDPNKIKDEINLVRSQGYAINKEEYLVGEIVIATVVLNTISEPIAAIHVPLPINQWPKERVIQELAPEIIATARSIQVPA